MCIFIVHRSKQRSCQNNVDRFIKFHKSNVCLCLSTFNRHLPQLGVAMGIS